MVSSICCGGCYGFLHTTEAHLSLCHCISFVNWAASFCSVAYISFEMSGFSLYPDLMFFLMVVSGWLNHTHIHTNARTHFGPLKNMSLFSLSQTHWVTPTGLWCWWLQFMWSLLCFYDCLYTQCPSLLYRCTIRLNYHLFKRSRRQLLPLGRLEWRRISFYAGTSSV